VKGPDVQYHDTAGLIAEKAALLEVGAKLRFTQGETFHSTEVGQKVLAGI
jgi:hypothetical protein